MPEMTILAGCARMHQDLDTREELATLFDGQVDWGRLVTAARYHRFIPFLFTFLKSVPEPRLEPGILEEIERLFHRTVKWNMLVTAELLFLADNLHDGGIPVIPLKGPVLSQLLYGNISQREFDDLDILIRREDFKKTKEVLMALGYQPEQMANPVQDSLVTRSRHHFQFYNPGSACVVEVHWEISPRIYSFNLDMAEVWNRVKPLTLSGRDLACLSPEDTLLILCEHGTRHYWKRLLWIADLARLVEWNGLDWPWVLQQSRNIGSERVLLLGISLAETVFHANSPPLVSQRIQDDPEVRKLTLRILGEIFSGRAVFSPVSSPDGIPDITEELLYLQARERFRDRMRYYLRRGTSPTREDLDSYILPGFLSPLYPVIRIGRMIKKYNCRIWKWI